MDDPKVVAALVAGGVSLLVAAISLVTTLVTRRWAFANDKAIANIRQMHLRIEEMQKLDDEEVRSFLEAIGEATRFIQRFKDVLQIILVASNDSLTLKDAIDRLHSARDAALSSYQKQHPNLTENERRVFHDAKQLIVFAVDSLLQAFDQHRFPSEILVDQRQLVMDVRNQLSDCQTRLLESKTDRLFHRRLPRLI